MTRIIALALLCASLAGGLSAQSTALIDVNLVVGGPMARSGAAVTQSLWGDSSSTVRTLRGKIWRDTSLVDTLLALTRARLSARLGRPISVAPAGNNPTLVRPTTAEPALGKDEMLRRKNRIGGLPALTPKQAFADRKLAAGKALENAIVIDCNIERDIQSEGANKLTDRAARERAVVRLSITLIDRDGKRLVEASVSGLSTDRWKYFSRVMGLRQQDTSLSGREILDLYALALDRALRDRAFDRRRKP